MKIALILKDNLNRRPPVLSVCYHLIDLGHSLTIIACGISDETQEEFMKRGVLTKLVSSNSGSFKIPVIGNIFRWLLFRLEVTRILKKIDFDYIWVASADAALAMGKRLFKYKYFLQIQELYDTVPLYRKRLCYFMRNAQKVFVPEATRAHIFRAGYQLDETPVVLPNKPYNHPRRRRMEITDPLAKEAFDKIPNGSKKVFFQGILAYERDLRLFARAIEELGAPWVLVVQCPMHSNSYCDNFFTNFKFYHIPYLAAPMHLEVTSNVDIGLVTYMHDSLNTEFCAPNKIWEYSGFGLPMIANDVKGLLDTVGYYGAGMCLNLADSSTEDITKALLELDGQSEIYSRNCSVFYDSIDNVETIRKALLQVQKKRNKNE
ncbi:MAG: hypothetical protein JW943_11605 [Deltaproteobacteria bacterium]|nr:hypothetical protein [Deltaproteobacteria bacterium]